MVNVKHSAYHEILLDLCYGGISFLLFLVLFRKERCHMQSFAYFIHPSLVPTWERSSDFGFSHNLIIISNKEEKIVTW